MSPTVLTSNLTSPPGPPAEKSQTAAANQSNGLSLSSGTATPYSSTSTAVSTPHSSSKSSGDNAASAAAKVLVSENLPNNKAQPGDSHYYTNILDSTKPTLSTKEGSVVYGSAIDVLEILAVKHSKAVWVYDDAKEVGFGSSLASLEGQTSGNVYEIQSREGAGQEIKGYASKLAETGEKGKISVFATIESLQGLLVSLGKAKGDIVIHLSTTRSSSEEEGLELKDDLPMNVLAEVLGEGDEWEVVFSSGKGIVENASKVYGGKGKVLNVVETTFSGREVTSYTFPEVSTEEIKPFNVKKTKADDEINVVPSGYLARTLSSNVAVLELHSLYPSPDELFSALSGFKAVKVLGSTKRNADALKSILLSTLYSASTSSSTSFPTLKSVVHSPVTDKADARTIAFYTAPLSPLPELITHLFLSSPSLQTHLASYASTSTRGLLSVLSLSPASSKTQPLSPSTQADVTWLSDANIHKSTDILLNAAPNGLLLVSLPWLESEVPTKFSRSEIQAIKEKNLRVFLLDLDPASSTYSIKEQVAFLLLYTGAQKLPKGVWNVLDAFYSHSLSREDVEEAQAGLIELDPKAWEIPELEEGKVEKSKGAWEWDALPGDEGVVAEDEIEGKPEIGGWEIATRHLLFSEAYAVEEAKSLDDTKINTLRPSDPDETFLVTVSENRRLTPMTYDRNVFHLELDSTGTGLKYEIGEAIGIHGWNDDTEVSDFCQWYGLDPTEIVTFPSPTRKGTMETRTVFQLLHQNIDLFGRPGKAFYAALSKLATSKADAMTLKFISAPEGAELFKKMSEDETVTFADVLKRFRTARPGLEELVGLIPEIKPRHYSIASSQKAVGDKVELLIVTVDWLSSTGSPRFGQCTRYLAALKPGAKVTVSIKPSVMKLPPHDSQPIIMAGLGTGAAPFRAFMQHRAWQRSQGLNVGPLIYYFGSRYRSQEYLYGEEIEAYIASGVIAHAGLAFSRDGKDKVYIQHKMLADKKMLGEMLMAEKEEEKAYFYLCGPTWPVPDVYEALVGSLQGRGLERKEAEGVIEELKEEERYVLEVY